jgi:hypothetical protein
MIFAVVYEPAVTRKDEKFTSPLTPTLSLRQRVERGRRNSPKRSQTTQNSKLFVTESQEGDTPALPYMLILLIILY